MCVTYKISTERVLQKTRGVMCTANGKIRADKVLTPIVELEFRGVSIGQRDALLLLLLYPSPIYDDSARAPIDLTHG